ncbi:histidine phosphatase superfamily [Pavlovales sp. CCMP2436]|nr:histidine phosphatase superfamily [Pavlovales sp. CCMP2436]|mmetsp:Transcript_12678/g.32099  ORF Transcript_12678/g.32099 Transcript_12678/m.32099 type:complete len:286 (-) Transcript_12678:118-975(-)
MRLAFSIACLVSLLAVASAGAVDAATKRVMLVRHGHTEMNAFIHRLNIVARLTPGFEDPMMIDTRLTETGERQAEGAGRTLQVAHDMLEPGGRVQLVVCSPLTRALKTAELAFAHAGGNVPRIVHPLCAERRWHGSDLGRERPVLEREFPGCDFSLLPSRGSWGYARESEPETHPEGGPIPEESEPAFIARMQAFHAWLDSRPEQRIAVVTHWGVIYALSGVPVPNCDVLDCRFEELRPGDHFLEGEGGLDELRGLRPITTGQHHDGAKGHMTSSSVLEIIIHMK